MSFFNSKAHEGPAPELAASSVQDVPNAPKAGSALESAMRSAPDLSKGVSGTIQGVKPETQTPEEKPGESETPEGEGQEAKPTEERKPEMANKTKPTNNKKPNRNRQPSNETVVSRARRMMRSEMKKIAEALGMENYDEAEFKKQLEEMRKAREENLSHSERVERRLTALEESNTKLKAQNNQLNKELGVYKRKAENKEMEVSNLEIEHEIRRSAWEAGVQDIDYAIHRFKQHVLGLSDTDPDPDPKEYFEGMKKDPKLKYLFQEREVPAGPSSEAERSTGDGKGAPQSQLTEGAPKPAQTQETGKPPDVMDMSGKDFRDHVQSSYGFRPGISG